MNIFFNILQKNIKYTGPLQVLKNKDINRENDFDLEKYKKRIEGYNTNCHISPYIFHFMHEIQMLYNKTKFNVYNKQDNKHTAATRIKFAALHQLINNIFISNELKEEIINIFSKAQRIYFALSRFVNIYRYKKCKTVVYNDLSLNPLHPKDENTFIMLQSNVIYLFSLNDLIHIIETALCNSPNFFSDPLLSKNPYNNEPLNASTLYNIYLKLKTNPRLISTIFHLFFLDGFNLHLFNYKNEAMLRQLSIEKYIMNSPATLLYNSIFGMLIENSYTRKLSIHRDFPKDILVNIFRPFLLYYYYINYDFKSEKIILYKPLLSLKLQKFYEYNKLFGRRVIKVSSYYKTKPNSSFFTATKAFKKTITFNTEHISFHNICVKSLPGNYLFLHLDSDSDVESESDVESDSDIESENDFDNDYVYNYQI